MAGETASAERLVDLWYHEEGLSKLFVYVVWAVCRTLESEAEAPLDLWPLLEITPEARPPGETLGIKVR